jgi:hypothetical protein
MAYEDVPHRITGLLLPATSYDLAGLKAAAHMTDIGNFVALAVEAAGCHGTFGRPGVGPRGPGPHGRLGYPDREAVLATMDERPRDGGYGHLVRAVLRSKLGLA